MPIPHERVYRYLLQEFPQPTVLPRWLSQTYDDVEESLGVTPEENFEEHADELESRILHSRFSDVMQAGTGLHHRIGSPTVHTTLEGPIVLELVHITDIGVSAFSLERARQDRDQSIYLELLASARAGRATTEKGWLDLKNALPEYPRGVLKLILSDGHTELQAVEYKRLPFKLGRSKIGLKVRLEHVPIIGGVAYLEPENIKVLGGDTPGGELRHFARLREELHERMRDELRIAQVERVNPRALFSCNLGGRMIGEE